MTNKPETDIAIERTPKGEWKVLGGGDRDQWNKRLLALVTKALPVDQTNTETDGWSGGHEAGRSD
jgi:hypothetical protein